MGQQIPLLTVAAAPKRARPTAAPALEGKTWVRCKVCNRPIYNEASRVRGIGDTCFRRQTKAREQRNQQRQQQELGNQLILFPHASGAAEAAAEAPGIDPTLGF